MNHHDEFWVAHPSRMLIGASRADELSFHYSRTQCYSALQDCFGETPKPTRATHALPG